jgi:transcriptional regulator with XRE-family HTH domain
LGEETRRLRRGRGGVEGERLGPRLAEWERGERRRSVEQLRKLARVYKRPISLFYLPEPPRDFKPIKDVRVAWAEERQPPSPDLLAEIEAAHERREIRLELLEDVREHPPSFRLRASLHDDPDLADTRGRKRAPCEHRRLRPAQTDSLTTASP